MRGALQGATSTIIAIGLLTALAACAPRARPEKASVRYDARMLIGAWVHEGDACAGDAGVVYSADGAFAAYDVGGTWRLAGDRLLTVTTTRGAPDEPQVTPKPPERRTAVIQSMSASRRTERWDDGSVHTYVRCQ